MATEYVCKDCGHFSEVSGQCPRCGGEMEKVNDDIKLPPKSKNNNDDKTM